MKNLATTAPLFSPTLNPEQQAAVDTREGRIAVLGSPGCGKTKVLVSRYAALAKEVDPAQILSVTFTNEAAKTMRERAGIVEKTDRPSGFCTFDSLSLSFAVKERESFPFRLAEFPLLTPPQQAKSLYEISKRFLLDFKTLKNYISRSKRAGNPPETKRALAVTITEYNLAAAYGEYEKKCQDQGLLDFDSMMFEMVRLLQINNEMRARWTYQFGQIDESQDADILQFRLAGLIFTNLFAVGDFRQSIYGFRGGNPNLLLKFEEMFEGSRTLHLTQNYRSTPQIVDFSNKVYSVPGHPPIMTENAAGPEVKITRYGTNIAEAEGVVESVRKLDGAAILARTNAYLFSYEAALSDAGVKYRLLGHAGFWSQPEIKNLMAFVQIAVAPVDYAVLAAIRAPFVGKFIRKKELCDNLKKQQEGDPNEPSILRLLQEYRDSDSRQQESVAKLVHLVQRCVGATSVPQLDQLTGASEYYSEEESTPENDPVQNIKQLVKIAARFSSLAEFLKHANKMRNAAKSKKGVALGSIHASKGLEFAHVFVAGVQESHLPHEKATDLEEERRVFFVAASRPEQSLNISYYGTPSRFIREFVNYKPEPIPENITKLIGAISGQTSAS